jgi:hypothetical protein
VQATPIFLKVRIKKIIMGIFVVSREMKQKKLISALILVLIVS